MAFNVSQYGHHLSPYVCLLCVKIPPIHEKAFLERLFQYLRRFCPSGVADLLFLRHTQCSWCTPRRRDQELLNPCFRNCSLTDDFHLQTLPVSLRSSKQRRMLFTRGGFLLHSLANLRWTLTNDFNSANYKTHYAFSLSVNIIKSVQRHQRQTQRRCDLERSLCGDT
jgi:hypothetical protein